MKEIKLFFDMEFTSLSPDAQVISLGIVSEESPMCVRIVDESLIDKSLPNEEVSKYVFENKLGQEVISKPISKSFYAEFTSFDINRCDDWVKENVVGKLQFYPESHDNTPEYDFEAWDMCKDTRGVIIKLHKWLSQFSAYQLQFVTDCGTFDWYHLLQLIGEWDERYVEPNGDFQHNLVFIGLPKLPSNISPVPQDMNDLIAFKNGISVKEAFDLNREELLSQDDLTTIYCGSSAVKTAMDDGVTNKDWADRDKHNALWDAKVIKAIYDKLML